MPTRSLEKVNNLQSEPNLTRHKKTSKLQPKTQIKVEEAAKMITDGKGMNDVIEFIQGKYGISYEQSRHYWVAACRYLVADMDETREALVRQNLQRLEKIVNECMEEKDYKLAKETISEMNKMLGVGKDGVQVGIRNNPNTNTQEVYIKFD